MDPSNIEHFLQVCSVVFLPYFPKTKNPDCSSDLNLQKCPIYLSASCLENCLWQWKKMLIVFLLTRDKCSFRKLDTTSPGKQAYFLTDKMGIFYMEGCRTSTEACYDNVQRWINWESSAQFVFLFNLGLIYLNEMWLAATLVLLLLSGPNILLTPDGLLLLTFGTKIIKIYKLG